MKSIRKIRNSITDRTLLGWGFVVSGPLLLPIFFLLLSVPEKSTSSEARPASHNQQLPADTRIFILQNTAIAAPNK